MSSSTSSVVAAAEVDMVDRRSSPVSTGVDFESYCNDQQREAMSAATEENGIEPRYSPPQLGQPPAHTTVVLSSSPPTAGVDNTGSGNVYSLFNMSASDNSDFASKSRAHFTSTIVQ